MSGGAGCGDGRRVRCDDEQDSVGSTTGMQMWLRESLCDNVALSLVVWSIALGLGLEQKSEMAEMAEKLWNYEDHPAVHDHSCYRSRHEVVKKDLKPNALSKMLVLRSTVSCSWLPLFHPLLFLRYFYLPSQSSCKDHHILVGRRQ